MSADMSEQMSQMHQGLRSWAVWGLAAAGFGLAFFMRVSPSVMSDDLMREFTVGAAVLGNLSAIYFYIYASSQVPVGVLMDRWGPRAMISGSMMLAAFGAGLFAMSHSLHAAYAGRFLIGAGSACAFVGALVLASRWFPPRRFAFFSGLTMLVGMAGGLLGQAPLALLVEAVGWRSAMMVGAAAAGTIGLAVWAVVRDRPPVPAQSGRPLSSWRDAGRDVGVILSNGRVWAALFVGACFSGPLLAFGGLWGVPYMMVKYGLERPDAAFYVSFNLLGWAVGAPFGGWLSDHIGRRKAPVIVSGMLTLACMSVLFYIPGVPLPLAGFLIFATGMTSAAMVIIYALAREITPPGVHGTVTGFVNMGTVGGGAVLQPIIGLVLDRQWDGQTAGGVRVYTAAAYDTAFLCLVVSIGLGLVVSLALRETFCTPLELD